MTSTVTLPFFALYLTQHHSLFLNTNTTLSCESLRLQSAFADVMSAFSARNTVLLSPLSLSSVFSCLLLHFGNDFSAAALMSRH
jgi:hypothetical protein